MGIQLNVTEWMKGHVGFGATDYAAGEKQGKAENKIFQHEVLIQMQDIDRFASEPKHAAPMKGHVVWLGDKVPFDGGEFNMLVDSTNPKIKYMFYRIPYADGAGKKWTMLGHKTLRDDPGLDLWDDITTLFIQIYEGDAAGHDFTRPSGDTPEWPPGHVAKGIIHISLRDGIHSGLSFEAPGATRVQKVQAIKTFLGFYGTRVVDLWVKQSATKTMGLVIAGVAVLGIALVGVLYLAFGR